MCVEREGLLTYLFWISVLGGDTNVHDARWCKRVIFRMLILNLWGWDCTEIATLSHCVLLWNQEEEGLKQGLRLWPARWPDQSRVNQLLREANCHLGQFHSTTKLAERCDHRQWALIRVGGATGVPLSLWWLRGERAVAKQTQSVTFPRGAH